MGNFFTTSKTASHAQDAFQRAIDATQSNVTNANTPGYVKQVAVLRSVDTGAGRDAVGGVAEQTVDTRSQFAETSVQQQVSLLGEFQQLQASLAPLQTAFDVSSSSAIPSALNRLFQSFSNWSTQPNDVAAQANVINAAQQAAAAFQQTAAQLATLRGTTDATFPSTGAPINQD